MEIIISKQYAETLEIINNDYYNEKDLGKVVEMMIEEYLIRERDVWDL